MTARDLQNKIDSLEQDINKLETGIEKAKEVAKEHLRQNPNDKSKVNRILQEIKFKKNEIKKLSGMVVMMSGQKTQLEQGQNLKEVQDLMKQAQILIKETGLDEMIDGWEDILDEIKDN